MHEELDELKDLFEFDSLSEESKREYKIAVLKKKERMLEAKLEFIREINRLIQKSAEEKKPEAEKPTEEEAKPETKELAKEEEIIPSDTKEEKEPDGNGNGNGKEKPAEKETKAETKETEEPKKNAK